MRRPQFSLKTLLWLMAVVAAFCAGATWQHRRDEIRRLADLQAALSGNLLNVRGGSIGLQLPASQAPRSETQD